MANWYKVKYEMRVVELGGNECVIEFEHGNIMPLGSGIAMKCLFRNVVYAELMKRFDKSVPNRYAMSFTLNGEPHNVVLVYDNRKHLYERWDVEFPSDSHRERELKEELIKRRAEIVEKHEGFIREKDTGVKVVDNSLWEQEGDEVVYKPVDMEFFKR